MYQLQAFPTLSVLKDFTPYRGIILSSPIELSDHQEKLMFSSLLKGTNCIRIDTTLILSRIAQEWNYDLELLKEGNGETGVADHSFVVYAHENSSPQIIRWKLGKAQILITVGTRARQMQLIAIGNKAAVPTLDKLNELFGDIGINPDEHIEISAEVNNQVVKTVIQNRLWDNFFKASVTLSIPMDGKLSANQFKHYVSLVNSCKLSVYPHPSAFTSIHIPHLKINAKYDDSKEIPEDILKIIYNEGISQCQELMNYIVGQYLVPNYGSHAHIAPEDFSVDDLERARWLDVQSKNLVESNYSTNESLWDKVSASINFTEADLKVLRGTRADITQHRTFQDIPFQEDLLEHLVQSLIYLPMDLVRKKNYEGIHPPFTIKKGAKAYRGIFDGLENVEDENKTGYQMKIEPLKNAYFSVHDGLPVRVDHTVLVWRESDTEALACDVWYDLDSCQLHVANLYRVKVRTA